MNANKKCLLHYKGCLMEKASGCPISHLVFDEEENYSIHCNYFILQRKRECSHSSEKYVLFNIPRYRCKYCGKELE